MPQIGRKGDRLNLLIRKGATFSYPFRHKERVDGVLSAVDLTDCTLRAKIRKAIDEATAYVLTCTITDAEAGEFTVSMSATNTALIPYLGDIRDPENWYYWDLELEFPDTSVKPLCYGDVKIFGEVTT